jgi:phosphopantothenoylcysteine decarboxylase
MNSIKHNLVIVFTGTVASSLAEKIVWAFRPTYNVSAVFTEASKYFINYKDFSSRYMHSTILDDSKEWFRKENNQTYMKDDVIPHIKLATDNDALLIIASADFLAKMANGQCDDLASSLYRAWHRNRPVIIAPAMNTHMWDHPITSQHIRTLEIWGCRTVWPVEKKLACGDIGIGALAPIEVIKSVVDSSLENQFPLRYHNYSGVPVGNHLGAFLSKRKHAPHTGVDLYTVNGQSVFAMNDGVVVSIEDFTGRFDGSTWWEDTKCILIKHWFGVVCYGEITPRSLKVGDVIYKGDCIGEVKRVLKEGKERPDIKGHSLSMLHIELYNENQKKASTTYTQDKDILRDPTPWLKDALGYNGIELKGNENE